ncbi:DNA polymerase III subunit delta' [Enterovibrio sp. ZSDZ35]|uniref:DNA polymerase III subunit delta' n=1 Tax=Enterovibrio qingdaonensis TaxID=2899818 RepID=A0ABT5QP36_9GAMM|nr:DNA polymerase III subunit delta' [Enterovibrio sp. ZSDZ35]MDD1782751.1 DNA polymerase III subunit delta' [Enterovibrio sp. ZSDZ35]
MLAKVYPWHNEIWHNWQQLLGQERLHHAVLLSAPKGSGKLELSALLAKTILCKNGTTEPCGTCHSCQLFDADTHPDFHWLRPEAEGKQLGVDVIRAGNKYAWETSQLGGQRVILVQNADRMGEAAANALLKTLEEPPANCHFILLTESMDSMLPTVVSRCNKWKPKMPDELVAKRWVESELFESVPLQVIRINRGAPLAAKAFIDKGSASKHEALLSAFTKYLTDKQGIFNVTESIVKSDREGLQWLSFLLLDVLKIQQGTHEALVHCDSEKTLVSLAEKLPQGKVLQQLMALNKLKAELTKHTGLNGELLISRWLSDF